MAPMDDTFRPTRGSACADDVPSRPPQSRGGGAGPGGTLRPTPTRGREGGRVFVAVAPFARGAAALHRPGNAPPPGWGAPSKDTALSENARDWVDLKREVVEARNQAIRTENQVKNLTLDIKNFERRFDGLESRVRLTNLGVYFVVGLTSAAAAWFVGSAQSRAYEAEVAQLKDAVRDEHAAAETKGEALARRLEAVQTERRGRETAAAAAVKVLALLDEHNDDAAAAALDRVEFAALNELERRACARKFEELRARQATAAWRRGRQAMLQARPDEAVQPFRQVLALDANGRFGPPARSQLSWALWQSKRYEDAEAALRPWATLPPDQGGSEDGRYLLGTTLLRLKRRDEGRPLLQELASSEGRFAVPARAYLQALEQGLELPDDLPGGRVRVSRRLPGPQAREAVPAAHATP